MVETTTKTDAETIPVTDPKFWDVEFDSPLLERNWNFLSLESGEIRSKEASAWVDLLPLKESKQVPTQPVAPSLSPSSETKDGDGEKDKDNNNSPLVSTSPEFDRIFLADAERTFASETYRKRLAKLLSAVFYVVGEDYHQGLAFLCGYLTLLLPTESIVRIVRHLNATCQDGYFKSAPTRYFADADVVKTLLEKRKPDLAKLVFSNVPPETFCSKLLIGMGINVLSIQGVFRLIPFVLARDERALFALVLAFFEVLHEKIVAAKGDVGKTLAILRLEMGPKQPYKFTVEEVAQLSEEIVDACESIYDSLDVDELARERLLAQELLLERLEKRKQFQAQCLLDDDEEIIFSDEDGDDDATTAVKNGN